GNAVAPDSPERIRSMALTNLVERWAEETASLVGPDRVVWCDGSKIEYDRLIEDMLRDGTLLPLHSRAYPSCYLHRSHPPDGAPRRPPRAPSSSRPSARARATTPARPTTGWPPTRRGRASAGCSAARCAAAPCT